MGLVREPCLEAGRDWGLRGPWQLLLRWPVACKKAGWLFQRFEKTYQSGFYETAFHF